MPLTEEKQPAPRPSLSLTKESTQPRAPRARCALSLDKTSAQLAAQGSINGKKSAEPASASFVMPGANTFETELDELDQLDIAGAAGDSADGGGAEVDYDDAGDVDVGSLNLNFQRKKLSVQHTEIFEHPFIAAPDARWRSSWDALMITVLVWIGVTVPYRLAFKAPAQVRKPCCSALRSLLLAAFQRASWA